MESKSSPKRINSHNENEEEAFPKRGLKLSYLLKEFVPRHAKTLEGKTTAQVCEEIVEPLTQSKSYCDLLKEQRNPGYGSTAQVFISHAHCHVFLDVINALSWYFRDNLDVVIWFDLFSINQHANRVWSFGWLSTTFQSAIGSFGRVVMVMSPWNDPLPFTRSWCVFEAFCAAITGASLEIALSGLEEQKFIQDIQNAREAMATIYQIDIRAEKSQASIEEDRTKIFEAIQKTVGFSTLDSMVFKQYRIWVVSVVSKALKACTDESQSLALLKTLGVVYTGQGKFDRAKQCLEDLLTRSKAFHGEESEESLASTRELGELYREQGLYDDALPIHSVCLQKRSAKLGRDHIDTLQSMQDLAKIHGNLGNYNDAQRLYEECLEKRTTILGEENADTLLTHRQLALLYHHQGKFHTSRRMLEDNLQKSKDVLGPHHPMTLISMKSLAGHCLARGETNLAQHLYEQTLEQQSAVHGLNHPNTLVTMHNLASLYRRQESHEMAKEMFSVWVERSKRVFGDDSIGSLSEMIGIARYFYDLGDVEEAKQIWRFCLGLQRKILGGLHEETIMTKKLLSEHEF